MLIREDVEHTYFNSRKKRGRPSLRCEVKCDNPECGKTFYRKKSRVKLIKRHYCNKKCQSAQLKAFDICKIDGCKEKFSNHKSKYNICERHRRIYYRKTIKPKLLELMGNACVCCGERDLMFLQIDHVFNDGHKDRKKNGRSGGLSYYRLLLKIWNETPERLQLLCANCNQAKAKNGGVLYRPEKFTRRKLR